MTIQLFHSLMRACEKKIRIAFHFISEVASIKGKKTLYIIFLRKVDQFNLFTSGNPRFP